MVNNLFLGTENYNCYCEHKDHVLQDSVPKVTAAANSNADLIVCGSCNHRWYSKRPGFFGWECPKCHSKAPIMAELSQNRNQLVQGSSNYNKQERIKRLKRVINAPFEVTYHMPPPIRSSFLFHSIEYY